MNSLSLAKLFKPATIAVVGASREPNKLGNIIVANLQKNRFPGDIFPINPSAKKINGLLCFADYSLLPRTPDLAIIALPAEVALEILPAIAKKGTKHLVILSAGFKEIGHEGLEREEKLITLAREHNLKILGPNCLGFINNSHHLNATFGQALNPIGSMRFISQSGAIATAIFDWAAATGVGFSDCITLGNKTILDENDILEFWEKMPREKPAYDTKGLSRYRPIGMYLESIKDGERFIRLAQALGKNNPLFVLRPGKSDAATLAMQSHTGAMANDDAVLDVALAASGVVRCDGVEDFFDLSKAFAWENAPEGPGVAIVSNAGGPAVVTTDAIKNNGLELAAISKKTHEILKKVLPRAANIHNPIDVLGDALADRYKMALEAVLKEKQVKVVIIILTPQVMTQIEETALVIGEMSKKYRKPIICSFMGAAAIEKGEKILNKFRIPSFRYPERAVKALASMWRWRAWHKYAKPLKSIPVLGSSAQRKIRNVIDSEVVLRHTAIAGGVAQMLAASAGIVTAPSVFVTSTSQAKKKAGVWGYPVVLKISSSKLLHKTESHAVIVNINSSGALEKAYNELQAKAKKIKDSSAQFEMQKQIVGGVEVVVGLKRDPSFGLVLIVGAGGILANLLQDRVIALATIQDKNVLELLKKSKIGAILLGYRGDKAYAVKPLIKMIQSLTVLAETFPEIKEIEINPVLVTRERAYAADTKIVLKT